jgi:hypothetical protein
MTIANIMVGIHEVCGPYLRLSEFYQQNLVCDKIIIAYSISNSKPRLEFAIIVINFVVRKKSMKLFVLVFSRQILVAKLFMDKGK